MSLVGDRLKDDSPNGLEFHDTVASTPVPGEMYGDELQPGAMVGGFVLDAVIARGGFGSPTIYLDTTDMYFGNDRMPLIREALQRRNASAA